MDRNTRSGNLVTRRVYGEIEEILDEVDTKFELFKNFDRIQDAPSDHRFLTYKLGGLKQVLSGSSSRKKIQLEWDNLENNLPSCSIFVRAYERRIDLMRAVIVGPPDSPYEHGLFVFDIFLPWNYPTTPPRIYYRPCGLNSNSDNFGVLFLNFETWYKRVMRDLDDDGAPVSILDVLLAIQKLFLSRRPDTNISKSQDLRFSEMDGFRPTFPCLTSCAHSSILENNNNPTKGSLVLELQKYNKMDFLFTCRKIIWDLREAREDFKDLVAGHYRKRANSVLLKLKENMDGSELMVFLFQSLYEAFRNNGSYVGHYLGFSEAINQEKKRADSERTRLKNQGESSVDGRQENKYSGFLTKTVNRIKKNVANYLST